MSGTVLQELRFFIYIFLLRSSDLGTFWKEAGLTAGTYIKYEFFASSGSYSWMRLRLLPISSGFRLLPSVPIAEDAVAAPCTFYQALSRRKIQSP